MKRQVPFFNQALDQLVEHLLQLRTLVLAFILVEHLLNLVLTQKSLVHQRLQQRPPQSIERSVLRHRLTPPVVIVVVAGIEQRIREPFHQVSQIDRPDLEASEF